MYDLDELEPTDKCLFLVAPQMSAALLWLNSDMGGGGLDAESHQAVKSRSLETIPNFRFDSIHSRK